MNKSGFLAMRDITIVEGFEEMMGRKLRVQHKSHGLAKDQEVARQAMTWAGWPPDTDFDIAICQSTEEFGDADYEEMAEGQRLIGNDSYGFEDADYSKMKRRPGPKPYPNQSWVFVLNQPSYHN